MENDIPDSRILDIEYFADSNSDKITDLVKEKIAEIEKKTLQMKRRGEEPKYNIFDRLVNQLCKDMPYGSTYDTIHILLTNAIMFSFGCGWISQTKINEKDPKFKQDYQEKFRREITQAYMLGQKYANAQKLSKQDSI